MNCEEKLNEKDNRLNKESRILIKDGEKCFFVPVFSIFLVESFGNYVNIYFEDKKPMMHRTLSYLETRLPDDIFFRANRQYIFNINFIKKIDTYFNSTFLIELENGFKIDLSQRQSARFREKIEL